jgi:hypothetical protein
MSLWWNNSLVLIMEKEDVKILREMDFIARSLTSKRFSRPNNHYAKRISQTPFSARVIYN